MCIRDSELFCIRRGQLIGQTTMSSQSRLPTVTRLLERAFAGADQPEAATSIPREKVDEMHLLDTWLQRNDERLVVIQVDPAAPAASAETVLEALRRPVRAATRPGVRARAS